MGRGRGGYTEIQQKYLDSGQHKVTDSGAIFVAKQYFKKGYEVVFRQKHPQERHTLDITIKTSDDKNFVKNIEVKQVTSFNPSQIAKHIKKAQTQTNDGDTIAFYLPNHINDTEGIDFVKRGLEEAKRKRYWSKRPIEAWFKNNQCVEFQSEGE